MALCDGPPSGQAGAVSLSMSFLMVSLVVIATPGTGAVYTVVSTLAHGLRGGLLAAVANGVCLVPHVLAVITGLASLLHASAVAFSAIRYAGVAYLLYLAVQTWRGAGNLSLDTGRSSPTSGMAVFWEAMVLNLLNPKLTIFFVAFLPQFVDPGSGGVVLQMLVLSAAFAALTVAVYAVYAVLAQLLRRRIVEQPQVARRAERGFAIVFAVLAARLAGSGP